MSVSFISFSHSSDRSSDTSFFSGSPSLWAWKSLGQGRDQVSHTSLAEACSPCHWPSLAPRTQLCRCPQRRMWRT